jgi:hypothetical protein
MLGSTTYFKAFKSLFTFTAFLLVILNVNFSGDLATVFPGTATVLSDFRF